MTAKEVAHELGIHLNTVYRHASALGGRQLTPQGKWFFDIRVVRRFADSLKERDHAEETIESGQTLDRACSHPGHDETEREGLRDETRSGSLGTNPKKTLRGLGESVNYHDCY